MKKKIINFLLVLTLCFNFTACTDEEIETTGYILGLTLLFTSSYSYASGGYHYYNSPRNCHGRLYYYNGTTEIYPHCEYRNGGYYLVSNHRYHSINVYQD